MSVEMLNMFSRYELQARVFPSFIAVSPIGVTVLIWYPEIISLESSFLTIFVLFIILFSLAKVAREFGKRIEKRMIKEERGFPTTRFLKHSDNTLNIYTKMRYHKYLNEHIPDMQLPSKEEELESSDGCTEKYNSAIHWLLEKTRDNQKYSLIYEDNINYGFSRNMVGIKYISICLAIISLLIDFIGIYQSYGNISFDLPLKVILSIFISLFFVIYWIFLVKKKWVKSASEAYARSLLAACEEIN